MGTRWSNPGRARFTQRAVNEAEKPLSPYEEFLPMDHLRTASLWVSLANVPNRRQKKGRERWKMPSGAGQEGYGVVYQHQKAPSPAFIPAFPGVTSRVLSSRRSGCSNAPKAASRPTSGLHYQKKSGPCHMITEREGRPGLPSFLLAASHYILICIKGIPSTTGQRQKLFQKVSSRLEQRTQERGVTAGFIQTSTIQTAWPDVYLA
ncbi:hypothetical protein AOLI_G00141100 [Acnodon oligacanthus]